MAIAVGKAAAAACVRAIAADLASAQLCARFACANSIAEGAELV